MCAPLYLLVIATDDMYANRDRKTEKEKEKKHSKAQRNAEPKVAQQKHKPQIYKRC